MVSTCTWVALAVFALKRASFVVVVIHASGMAAAVAVFGRMEPKRANSARKPKVRTDCRGFMGDSFRTGYSRSNQEAQTEVELEVEEETRSARARRPAGTGT